MKIVIFGSTGGIGSETVKRALAAGHSVTAVARRPETIQLKHPCLKVVKGDVMQPQTLQNTIGEGDVVVSALGVHDLKPTTLYSQGVANIIQAMKTVSATRLICVSASGIEPGPLWQRILAKPILWTVLKESYTDLVRMEMILKQSDVNWMILRLPMLTDGPSKGTYQIAVNRHLKQGMSLSRADVADFIVKHLTDETMHNAWVETAY